MIVILMQSPLSTFSNHILTSLRLRLLLSPSPSPSLCQGYDIGDINYLSDAEIRNIPEGAPVKPISELEHVESGNICPCESISR